MRRWLRRRRRRSWPLLLPLIEFLRLLLLLLRAALLHRRRGPHQRMRFLLRRRIRLLVVVRRGHIVILQLRTSLLLVNARLRLRQSRDLRVGSARLSKWPEALLGRLRPAALIHRRGLRGRHRTNQRLLIQMASRLSLALFERPRWCGWRSNRHHGTGHNCRRRLRGNRPSRA